MKLARKDAHKNFASRSSSRICSSNISSIYSRSSQFGATNRLLKSAPVLERIIHGRKPKLCKVMVRWPPRLGGGRICELLLYIYIYVTSRNAALRRLNLLVAAKCFMRPGLWRRNFPENLYTLRFRKKHLIGHDSLWVINARLSQDQVNVLSNWVKEEKFNWPNINEIQCIDFMWDVLKNHITFDRFTYFCRFFTFFENRVVL